ncbi:hypothetical protein V5O48_016744 [Marasmius crinis-equi]|uniref:Uncharacterized protein n=1 Tax=Marasmius crinis-equi TaxID=585013 RepID=A0ABR3EQY3_9AGAR
MVGEVKNPGDSRFNGLILSTHPKDTVAFGDHNQEEYWKAGVAFGNWLGYIRFCKGSGPATTTDVTPSEVPGTTPNSTPSSTLQPPPVSNSPLLESLEPTGKGAKLRPRPQQKSWQKEGTEGKKANS